MIYLDTEKKEAPDWILKNDWYFNLFTGNLPLTEEDKRIIALIDGASVREDNRIETKYGLGTIRNLSSGCKTYMNIVKNPDKFVSVKECGPNVLSLIFMLDEIHIYMDYPERFAIGEKVQILFNKRDIVFGRHGYETWWSKEYERRAALRDSVQVLR